MNTAAIAARNLEVVARLNGMLATWSDYELSVSNEKAIGDHVVVDAIHRRHNRESEAEVELRQCQLWTLHDGKLTRCRVYEARADALGAIEGEA